MMRRRETYDLLNDFRGGEDINDTLVDAHLEAIPGVGSFSAGGLTGGNLKNLGGHAGGSTNLNTLILGSTDEISADCRGWNRSNKIEQSNQKGIRVSMVR